MTGRVYAPLAVFMPEYDEDMGEAVDKWARDLELSRDVIADRATRRSIDLTAAPAASTQGVEKRFTYMDPNVLQSLRERMQLSQQPAWLKKELSERKERREFAKLDDGGKKLTWRRRNASGTVKKPKRQMNEIRQAVELQEASLSVRSASLTSPSAQEQPPKKPPSRRRFGFAEMSESISSQSSRGTSFFQKLRGDVRTKVQTSAEDLGVNVEQSLDHMIRGSFNLGKNFGQISDRAAAASLQQLGFRGAEPEQETDFERSEENYNSLVTSRFEHSVIVGALTRRRRYKWSPVHVRTDIWLLFRERHTLVSFLYPTRYSLPPKAGNHLRDPQRAQIFWLVITCNLYIYFVLIGRNYKIATINGVFQETQNALVSGMVSFIMGWTSRIIFRYGNSGLRDIGKPKLALFRWLLAWGVHVAAMAVLLSVVADEGKCLSDDTTKTRLALWLWACFMMWIFHEVIVIFCLAMLAFVPCMDYGMEHIVHRLP